MENMEITTHPAKLAILIDAENVVASHADLIFSQAEAMGDIASKEIYGTAAALTAWVAPVLKYAIHPNLTIRASKGKNSSDIALVIGAMDLLLQGGYETVVIASSDSDFSALSVRLRNAGVNVVGMGTEKSNALWRTACSSFIVLEHPAPAAKPQPAAKAQKAPAAKAQKAVAEVTPTPAPESPAKEPAKKSAPAKRQGKQPAASHEERMSVIEQYIRKRLDSSGGRLQVNSLFTGLNKLPEYQADRQDSGRKPLNYLSSTYAESFQFASSPDGKNWISRMDTLPLPDGIKPADEDRDERAEAAAEAVEPAVEAPVAQEMPEETAAEVPESEPVSSEAGRPAADLTQRLIDGGMDPDAAGRVAPIFERTANLRAAYNEIRKLFGNVDGRALYHQAKAVFDAEA